MPVSGYLKNVEDKYLVRDGKVFDVCPEVRQCPKCTLLIHHTSNCRWMTCPSCGYEFCFVCTKATCKDTFHYLKCPNKYVAN